MPCFRKILFACLLYLSFAIPAIAALNGTYTIDPSLSASATNYRSFSAAVSDLTSGVRGDFGPSNGPGVGGPVLFNVVAGTYPEVISIPFIAGTSAANTITFDGGDPELTQLVSSGVAAGDYTVQLNGADHIRLVRLGILNTGLSFGYALQLIGGADDVEVRECVLAVDETATGNYQVPLITGAVYSSYVLSAQNLLIEDCKVLGGKLGLVVCGSAGSYADGIVVRGNVIRSQEYAGIQGQYLTAPIIDGNRLEMRVSASGNTGMRISYVNGPSISGNTIVHPGVYGMYLNNLNSSGTGTATITNNMVGGGWVGTSTCHGFYLTNCRRVDLLHNSVSMDNLAGSARALYVTGTSSIQLNVQNNIFALDGAIGHAFYTTTTTAFSAVNYNDYHVTGGSLAFHGASFATLSTWQSAYPTLNSGSLSLAPNFVSDDDLHIVCSSLNNNGTPSAVAEDIDGNARSATSPDMGAHEYTPTTISLDLGPDLTHCGPLMVLASSDYREYDWSVGATTPFAWVNATTSLHLTVEDTNSCRATDSVMVTIHALPTAPFSTDSVDVCEGTESLSAENDGSHYLWSTGDTTQAISPPSVGVYAVTITTDDGCTVADTVTISLLPSPMIAFASDTSWFCMGDVTLLDAGPQPMGSTILWNTGANTQAVLASAPGYYHCQITTLEGCEDVDSIYAAAWMPPLDPLGDDRIECGATYTLDAANPGCSYAWSTGATTQAITASGSAVYSVTVTSPEGCFTIDTVNITSAPSLPVSLGPDRILCDGSSIVLNAGFPTYLHNWSTGATTPMLTVSFPGTYIVFVENPSNGCMGSDTVFVGLSTLSVELGPDQDLCDGSTMVLDAGPAPLSYFWSTGETTRTISVSTAGLYSVTATSTDGCDATDNILITALASPTSAFTAPSTAPLFSTVSFTESASGSPSITYAWDFGDGGMSTLPSPTHVFLAMLTYNVCLTVEDGDCRHTYCQDIMIGAPIGVEDGVLSQGVTVYPNPSHGDFALRFDLTSTEDVQMQLVDVTGRVIHTAHWNQMRSGDAQLSLGLPAGMYLVRLGTASGESFATPLVVE